MIAVVAITSRWIRIGTYKLTGDRVEEALEYPILAAHTSLGWNAISTPTTQFPVITGFLQVTG